MIPVLGVPVLNRPDLLYTMLSSTKGVDIEQIVIVDNGDVVPEITNGNIRVIRPGHNLGVSASWNLILKSTPKAPWWMFSNSDIEFAPGDLDRLSHHMETEGGVALLGTFSVFGVTAQALETVGFFDENFAPAYFEDNDYDYRCQLAGISLVGLPTGLRHEISSTLRSSESYHRQNQYTFACNQDYYRRKWGGNPTNEEFKTPFNSGQDPRSWTLDIRRLAAQAWSRDEPTE
jgi:GT2 family glycosyltransferase